MGITYVRELMNKPVFAIGVLPLGETSRDLAPSGFGMTPAKSFIGRVRQDILRFVAQKVLFAKSQKFSIKTLKAHGIESRSFVFDEMYRRATLVLQSGSPGLEYYRSDLSSNIRFIGALLPYSQKQHKPYRIPRHTEYDKVVLVTQGTVEKDVTKIIIPTLEAFKNTNTLVIATTGGCGTDDLRKKYPQNNFIIEDFIPFSDILPVCDVYITNGGYGGVMLGIQNEVPMVLAGVHEGKNEICARVGYFRIGLNLKTERPSSEQVRNAVQQVATVKMYKQNISRLAKELKEYDPAALLDKHMSELFKEPLPEHRLKIHLHSF